MAGQSLAMGEAFGKGFQYGKRKISSMSNEEFNALDFKQLSESIATDYKVMIPSMKESLAASDVLQKAVFDALGDIILKLPEAVAGMFSDSGNRAGLETPAPINTQHTVDINFSNVPLSGETVRTRAGGGLGDIRKQQEQSKEQQQKEIQKAVDEALRARGGQGPTLTPSLNVPTPQQQPNTFDPKTGINLDTRTKDRLQLPPAQSTVTSLRKAGQSQKLEKIKLNLQINNLTRQIGTIRNGMTNRNPYRTSTMVQASAARIKVLTTAQNKLKQSLANLIARYSF